MLSYDKEPIESTQVSINITKVLTKSIWVLLDDALKTINHLKGFMAAEVFDIDEACVYLKLAKPTLYKYVRVGAIPAFKMGRVWRFHKEVLDTWIRERVATDTTARTKKNSLVKSH